MTSSRLLNKFRQERTRSSNIEFKKQQIIFVNNIDVKRVTVNKQFRKTVKPCLTDEALKEERITLVENEKVVSDKTQPVKIFNEYFTARC